MSVNNGGVYINSDEYISYQIAVYKTNKKLVEFNDKLNLAPVEAYAHIHAQADETANDKRIYSNIGIVLQDYSNGTGSKTIRVTANISPDEAQYIYSRVQSCTETFDFNAEKIFGKPDEKGYAAMTKLKISRVPIDKDGQPRNYPWIIMVENGRGIAARGSTGGTYCQSNSYKCDKKAFINLNDFDFFKLMNRVSHFIDVWEIIYGSAVMKKAKAILETVSVQ